MQNIVCRADPDLGAQEEDPWDWNVAETAAQATKKSRTKGAVPVHEWHHVVHVCAPCSESKRPVVFPGPQT